MGDKGTQQLIPGVAPSAPLIIKASELPGYDGILPDSAPGEREKTSKNAAAKKKKKRKNAKKARKTNR